MHIKVYTYSHIYIDLYIYMNSSVYISGTTLRYRSICVVYIYLFTHSWVTYICMHTFYRCECMLCISRYTYTHIYIYTYVQIHLYTNCKTQHWFILSGSILRYRSIYVHVSHIYKKICSYSNAYLHICMYAMYIKNINICQKTHLYICIYIYFLFHLFKYSKTLVRPPGCRPFYKSICVYVC